MTIHLVLRRRLVARFLDTIARCVPDGRCVVRKVWVVVHRAKPDIPTNVADVLVPFPLHPTAMAFVSYGVVLVRVRVPFSRERHNSSEESVIRDTCYALSAQNVNAPDLNRV